MKKVFILFISSFLLVLFFSSCKSEEEKALERLNKLNNRIQKSKYESTILDLKYMSTAIESYMADWNKAPADLSFGGDRTRAFYIKSFPEKDPWFNDWRYKRDSKNHKIFWIASPGSDNIFNGFFQEGRYDNFHGGDIIFSNFKNSDEFYKMTYGPKIKKEIK